MAEKRSKVVVLGTGGTIAGWAPDPLQARKYQAGELTASDLVRGLGTGQDYIVTEEVARIDSKNMDWAVWQSLVARLQHWLDQDDVQGVVVTHGTDTLEETAILLHTLFSDTKTVVITGAMRAANVPDPDGPANLRHALALAGAPGSAGVVCVFAGQVHAAASVTKVNCQALNAFGSDDPVALDIALENLDALQKRFAQQATPTVALSAKALAHAHTWPWVELVFNHADQEGAVVKALLESKTPPQGWVVAGTGNGTMSQGLEAALSLAQQRGAWVWRTSRCAQGQVQAQAGEPFQTTPGLNPYKARVVLALALVAEQLSSTGL
jgi:L-asparaginase